MRTLTRWAALAAAFGGAVAIASPALAQGIASPAAADIDPSFDILNTAVTAKGERLLFQMTARGPAGAVVPAAHGQTAGSDVYAYVWPTGLDSAAAGFEPGQGILALAATAHPDFDDTPLYDENRDGDKANDGAAWHSHWVVLVPDETCGPGALKVKDIPAGAAPSLPKTWPGLPILLDSPGFAARPAGDTIEVTAPASAGAAGTAYDGVTAALRVNGDMAAPLLCVVRVHDVASGNLSLPGKIDAQ